MKWLSWGSLLQLVCLLWLTGCSQRSSACPLLATGSGVFRTIAEIAIEEGSLIVPPTTIDLSDCPLALDYCGQAVGVFIIDENGITIPGFTIFPCPESEAL
jgi:hypothetical protein